MKGHSRNWKNKYRIERLISLLGFIAISPLLILLALLQKILDPKAPIFYNSYRLGLNGKIFTLYKFRTMKVGSDVIRSKDNKLITLKNDIRITKYGRFLRLGFDELPQLLNILKGNMCLIGPRPDIPEEFDNYSDREKIRLDVLPGITGLTQILDGRNLSNKDNYELDVRYVLYSSFLIDLKIFFITLPYSLGLKKIGNRLLNEFTDGIPSNQY